MEADVAVFSLGRASGNEPHDPNVRGLDDLVSMVLAAIDEPADLIAQSMGGLVAVRVALAAPGKVRRLVLAATSGGVRMDDLGVADWRSRLSQRVSGGGTLDNRSQPGLVVAACLDQGAVPRPLGRRRSDQPALGRPPAVRIAAQRTPAHHPRRRPRFGADPRRGDGGADRRAPAPRGGAHALIEGRR